MRIWGNWLLNDESEGVVSGAGLLHEGLGALRLRIGTPLAKQMLTYADVC